MIWTSQWLFLFGSCIFMQLCDKYSLPACCSMMRKKRSYILKPWPCLSASESPFLWLTHYTVGPVGGRRAGRGAVMVCATAVESGHRRKTGIDVCWGVWWIALQQEEGKKKKATFNHELFSGLGFWYSFWNPFEYQNIQEYILLRSDRFHFSNKKIQRHIVGLGLHQM